MDSLVTFSPRGERVVLPRSGWFCLRTQPKHEHIAAAHLRQEPDVEAFLPRVRFKRRTRQGSAWVTEALFPNYLFAKFDLAAAFRKVCHTRGVRGIVHFGVRWPTVPEEIITLLKERVGDEAVHVIQERFEPGETVRISGGSFDGMEAVVSRIMPSSQRVAVLLEFLGRQTMVEMSQTEVISLRDQRQRVA